MLTENVAKLLMLDARGYSQVSTIESGGELKALNFIKKITEEICIHAKVTLRSESVSLYFVQLKYFCQLAAEDFAFDHPDFEKYEQIITMYAAKCLDIDVFATLDSLKDTIPEVIKEPKKTIAERKLEFQREIQHCVKAGRIKIDEAKKFFAYWTEMGPNDKKFRKEMEKKFDVKRRIDTWNQNNKNWKPDWKTERENKVKQRINKQVKEVTETKPVIKQEDVF